MSHGQHQQEQKWKSEQEQEWIDCCVNYNEDAW